MYKSIIEWAKVCALRACLRCLFSHWFDYVYKYIVYIYTPHDEQQAHNITF